MITQIDWSIILGQIFQTLGYNSFRNPQNLISAQRELYLLQASGVNLGYHFWWASSQELWKDIEHYLEAPVGVGANRVLKLSELTKTRLQSVKALCTPMYPEVPFERHDWVNLLAWLHWLSVNQYQRLIGPHELEKQMSITHLLQGMRPLYRGQDTKVALAWTHLWKHLGE